MTAHVLVPSIDEEKPATLSRRIVQALLRDELQFPGVIVSDDLEMKAIAKTYTVPQAAVEAIAAGCDALLVCSGDVDVQAATLEALVHVATVITADLPLAGQLAPGDWVEFERCTRAEAIAALRDQEAMLGEFS